MQAHGGGHRRADALPRNAAARGSGARGVPSRTGQLCGGDVSFLGDLRLPRGRRAELLDDDVDDGQDRGALSRRRCLPFL